MAGLEIQAAGRGDAAEAAQLLARAFSDDPLSRWFLPAESTRERRLRQYFLTELRYESLLRGAVDVARADRRIIGAAAWLRPGSALGTELAALPGYLQAFGRRISTVVRYQTVALAARPRQEPYWYLAIIGVDPARQGSGVGAALLRSRLAQCDQEGTAAYLESSKLANVPVYQHFGFEATGVLGLPEGAPAVTTMWRPPADAG
jgi:GNAT superfamily N-acetyltransferase